MREANMRQYGIICVFLACLVHDSLGAERVDPKLLLQHELHRRQRSAESVMSSHRFKRDADSLPISQLSDALSLDDDSELNVVQTTRTVQGTRLIKMQETHKGRVILDGVVTLEMDSEGQQIIGASGSVYRNISLDERGGEIDPEDALTVCLKHNSDDGQRDFVTHTKIEGEVLFDDELNAYPAYLVQYLLSMESEERRPTCTLDARNSSVIMSWDALDTCSDCTATGTGGNLKIGKIRYSELQKCLQVRKEDGVCYLENKYVRVINNNFTRTQEEDDDDNTQVAFYNCEEIDDETNGAYSPLLDALFFGTVVGKMYEDWYNMTNPLGDKMTFRVHFGKNYSNAFWNGYECAYGDGGEYYYPFVSLDIVGHEVGHGVTEKNSNLYYYEQWGAINEAFSDMAGETAEAYLHAADWMTGIDITKHEVPPLRFHDDPERDNFSISHADSYTPFLDPHLGSGVYNRAFYLLVHDYGLPIKEVFRTFLHANQMYWHHMSNYVSAACDVMKAAYDLGQDGSKFRQAFGQVGIETCDVEDHILGVKNGESYNDIKVSKDISPTFAFAVPGQFAESVFVNASSSQGEVYIVLSNKTWGWPEEYVHTYAEGLQSLQFDVPANRSLYVSITLSTQSATSLTDVSLTAWFTCVKNFTWNEEYYEEGVLHWHWQDKCKFGNEEEEEEEKEKDDEKEDDTTENDKGEDSDNDDKEDEKDKSVQTSISSAAHIFNFYNSNVIIVFPSAN